MFIYKYIEEQVRVVLVRTGEVDGARGRPNITCQRNNGAKITGGSLNISRLSLAADQHRLALFYYLTAPQLLGAPFYE